MTPVLELLVATYLIYRVRVVEPAPETKTTVLLVVVATTCWAVLLIRAVVLAISR